MKPKLKPPGTKRLKLKCEMLLSVSAFKIKLRRYTTAFADGEWVGIELDEERGQNGGAVDGVSYFACGAGRGLFVEAAVLRPGGTVAAAVAAAAAGERAGAGAESGAEAGAGAGAGSRAGSRAGAAVEGVGAESGAAEAGSAAGEEESFITSRQSGAAAGLRISSLRVGGPS